AFVCKTSALPSELTSYPHPPIGGDGVFNSISLYCLRQLFFVNHFSSITSCQFCFGLPNKALASPQRESHKLTYGAIDPKFVRTIKPNYAKHIKCHYNYLLFGFTASWLKQILSSSLQSVPSLSSEAAHFILLFPSLFLPPSLYGCIYMYTI